MFLRNVGMCPNYRALQPRRPYSSESPLWEPQIQYDVYRLIINAEIICPRVSDGTKVLIQEEIEFG
jgi:hypothetical protein